MNTTIGCPIPGASQPKQQPKTIVERIGEPAFLEQLAEECSELAQAALKTARKYRGENPTPKTIDECYDALQEEEENNYKYCPSCGARMVNEDE